MKIQFLYSFLSTIYDMSVALIPQLLAIGQEREREI